MNTERPQLENLNQIRQRIYGLDADVLDIKKELRRVRTIAATPLLDIVANTLTLTPMTPQYIPFFGVGGLIVEDINLQWDGATILTLGVTAGTLVATGGSITDTTGAIDFDNENLTTTGLITAGNLDVDTLNLNGNAITDSTGAITFDDENLTTTGLVTAGNLDVDTLNLDGNVISDSTGTISFDNENLATSGNLTLSAFTATRVPFFGVGGIISESANFTWSGTNLRASANADSISSSKYFGINGVRILSIDGTANLFLGELAGANNSGSYGVGIGYKALGGHGAGNSANYNLCIGNEAGRALTTGASNIAIGSSTLRATTTTTQNVAIGQNVLYANTASNNVGIGAQALRYNTTGAENMAIGATALNANVSGTGNVAIGYLSLFLNSTGRYNIAIGRAAMRNNDDGEFCVAIGFNALYTATSADRCVCLGSNAGYYETGNDKLFIDNAARTNEADGRVKALVYGVFDAAIANQLFRINGIVQITSIKSGATQAGAGAAANEVWKTASHASLPDNVLMIGV